MAPANAALVSAKRAYSFRYSWVCHRNSCFAASSNTVPVEAEGLGCTITPDVGCVGALGNGSGGVVSRSDSSKEAGRFVSIAFVTQSGEQDGGSVPTRYMAVGFARTQNRTVPRRAYTPAANYA